MLLLAFRNPVLVAKTAATLDYLSGGRLTLGVSLGGRDYEFASQGIPITQRVSRLRENLTVMRKLWTEQHVTFHGRYYHLDQVNMEPKPVQKPGIPILMGGSVDAVLKRSAEEADGWIAGSRGTPETFHESWQKVQAYARAAGKDPATLESGKLLYIDVGEDRAQCRDNLRTFTHAYYGPQYDVDADWRLWPPRGMRGEDSGLHRGGSEEHHSGANRAGCGAADAPGQRSDAGIAMRRLRSKSNHTRLIHRYCCRKSPGASRSPFDKGGQGGFCQRCKHRCTNVPCSDLAPWPAARAH